MSTKRYTTAEAAAALQISESLVRRYCREGRLGERIGRNFSITEKSLRAFAAVERARGRKATEQASRRSGSRTDGE